jgi:aspartate ammonia-lyase
VVVWFSRSLNLFSPPLLSHARTHTHTHPRLVFGCWAQPAAAYYGIQTQRAIHNFDITGVPISHFPELIVGLAMVKKAAALANAELGHLDNVKKHAIVAACDEIIVDGKLLEHFPVDCIQGGAGTSTNMNANEVIANRGLEILGHTKGDYQYLHPNNDVNMSQSTNDVYPTAARLAMIMSDDPLIGAVKQLMAALDDKAIEFKDMLKLGRTQLQDAVPMTLGQEFKGWSVTLGKDLEQMEQLAQLFATVNLGGTAIGRSHLVWLLLVVVWVYDAKYGCGCVLRRFILSRTITHTN